MMNKYVVELNDSDLICQICMGEIFCPMIANDGGVYCENCIVEWFKKNTNSPNFAMIKDGMDKKYIKCKLFSNIYRSINGMNCLYFDDLLDCPATLFDGKKNALKIMEIIDANYRDKRDSEMWKLTKIFSNEKMIKYLIKNISSDWKGIQKWGLIHYVCRLGSLKMIKYYVKRGADLEAIDCDEWRPIHYICGDSNILCSSDQLKAIRYLVDLGVDMEALTDKKYKPIHYVCSDNNNMCSSDQMEAIRYLVEQGIRLEAENNEKMRPIHFICSDLNKMCSSDQMEAIKYLIERGVETDFRCDGKLPLISACSEQNNMCSADQLELIKYLIDRKIDFNEKGRWGPMHFVCSSQNNLHSSDQLEAIKYMIKKDVDMDRMDGNRWRPIHYVCSYDQHNLCQPDQLEALRCLVRHGVLMDVENNDGEKPLDQLMTTGHKHSNEYVEMMRLFCKTNQKFNFFELNFEFLKETNFIEPKNRRYMIEFIIDNAVKNDRSEQTIRRILISEKERLHSISKDTYYHYINAMIKNVIKYSQIGDDLREIFNIIRTNVRDTKHMTKENYEKTIKILKL
jgi:ankyrin repeat protein